MRRLTVLSICVVLVFCVSFASSALASDEEDVQKVAEDFVKAINSSDYGLMSSIWLNSSETSDFNPNTGYPFLVQGSENCLKWWESTCALPAGTINVTLHHPQAVILDKNVAVVTGYHTAVINPPAAKEQTVMQARQTLVVKKANGKWLIVHQHASYLPIE